MLNFARSLKETSVMPIMPKNKSKQSDLIDFILPERQILLLFSIGIFRNNGYGKIKKKRRLGAFINKTVIIYST
ncbi:hypothetical protein M1E08_11030 [Erwinia sp. PK3-005]|uniref:Uncharacterized protein n=1 Tax=Mixta hanseatica TaxID=2872648 RepID=A0ABY4RBW4_9GAMM|nr:hypothetical protein [Mixta hanseatica]UQY45928.1 hypothetical protein K6958_09965 [Mixta hanseatica]